MATEKGVVVHDAASAIREADRLAAARVEARERIEREVAGLFARRSAARYLYWERWNAGSGSAVSEAR